MDVVTFFGQVTWFAIGFRAYFLVVGRYLLPLINRSLKLREKKLAYQLMGSPVGISSENAESSSLGYQSSLLRLRERLESGVSASDSTSPQTARLMTSVIKLVSQRSLRQIRSAVSPKQASMKGTLKGLPQAKAPVKVPRSLVKAVSRKQGKLAKPISVAVKPAGAAPLKPTKTAPSQSTSKSASTKPSGKATSPKASSVKK